MFILNKDLKPRTVVWAKRKIYYDNPEKIINNKISMYLITMINQDYFLGCPLTTNVSMRNATVLRKDFYPIKMDSRINECLYKLTVDDIVSSNSFEITEGTFNHFKRDLYRKIIIGSADSPIEYNEEFVEDFLKDHKPTVDDIVVYPSPDKVFKYYYVYDEDKYNYILLRLRKEESYSYSLTEPNPVIIPKNVRFFDYYSTHNITRSSVDTLVGNDIYQKKLGTSF